MDKNDKVYVAGHRGLVGSALIRELQRHGYSNIITRTHAELDLTKEQAVADFFKEEKPDYVFLAAAKVGGIHANNTYPAEFIYDNLAIQTNVIHQSYLNKVKRLLFLGSSCIYPKECPQPIKEEYLLNGPLEPTNRPYALAKIAGAEMCWSYNRQYGTQYVAVMPTNLYGLKDNYDSENSHVIPALIRKFYDAKANGKKTVSVWGSGNPRREFLYNDDLATACLFIINLSEAKLSSILNTEYAPLINVGYGSDITIRELADLIQQATSFQGDIEFDSSKPDGTPSKLLDSSLINRFGWEPKTSLEQGVLLSIEDYIARGNVKK